MLKPLTAAAFLFPLFLAGCSGANGELTAEGILTSRTACPAVAIPAETGDVTLFNPASSHDASAIDVVASLTKVRNTCDDTGDYVHVNATFEVYAQRRNANGARDVTLPYFGSVVQGGTNVVAKRLGEVTLHFENGQLRASGEASTSAEILRSAATLPEDVRQKITRKRKAGDAEAAVDPLSEPGVRTAVQRATFELLIGFQLTDAQLAYNATR